MKLGPKTTNLSIVSTVVSNMTNTSVVQEDAHVAMNHYTNVEQEEKSSTGTSNNDDIVDEKAESYNEEESVGTVVDESNKGSGNFMLWQDLRPMFPCDKCSYGAKKRYLLLRHLKTHCKDRRNTSKECNSNKIVDVTEDVNEVDNLDDLRIFSCQECSYNTGKRYLLSRHIKIHSGERAHKCSVCERKFTTAASLKAHVNMHYGVKNQVCQYCGKTFTTSGELNRHRKYMHTIQKAYKCTECDYAAVERSKLRRHLRYHTGERPHQCQHCTYASQDTYQLTRHLRTHTGEKPYKCDNCNATYANTTSLKLHKLVHNPTEHKIYSCELCPAKNARKSELRQHVKRMHFSDKFLKCKRCEEIFTDRYSYRVHNKTHDSQKCFKCQLCSFEAKKFIDLKTHMKIHSDEKLNDSDQSSVTDGFVRFKQDCERKTYVLKEKPYECQKCVRKFAYKASLSRHEAIHDKEQTDTQE